MRKHNYVDDRGNYQNVENLTLKQIYDRAYKQGYEWGKYEGIKCACRPLNKWKITTVKMGDEVQCNMQGFECPECSRIVMQSENFCPECGTQMKILEPDE